MEEQVRLGNRDKGWNDPPSTAFSTGPPAQSSPRRNLLNQRVAMPQNYASPQSPAAQAQQQQPPSSGPPLPSYRHTSPPPQAGSSTTPPPLPQGSSQSGSVPPGTHTEGKIKASSESLGVGNRGDGGDSTEVDVSCETTIALMRGVLEQCQNSLQKRVITDIERRLKVLQGSWENGKLSLPVQQRTAKLASDLKARRYDSAHEVHLALMLDHVSEVSQWMVGVKRLIHEARQALPLEALEADSSADGDSNSTSEPSPGLPAQEQDQDPEQSQTKTEVSGQGDATAIPTEGGYHGDDDAKEEQRTDNESGEILKGEELTEDVKQIDINRS